ncbi:splicing factor U2AF 26 kDa subunit isoform X5 [Hylobates moloch]|uniref:splicing factor U2AF 26 kDa subunit isoform X5 n=1 Tax=Hylobates moloch TaxID=81572 RepID=UPI0026747897|nr:splicing factor U2AF 26 kDa subunit isoform X5 [Hylobates moloch]XP_058281363.1 splicing factor U2AF 26 kDa subunit isoform X5 [Hylobates moloch]
MCVTTLGTTSWATSMSSSGGRRMQSRPWLNSITAGSTGRLCTLSCLLSLTSGSHAVASMRWGNVPEVASATSCICDPFPRTSGGSSMGGDPGAGRPRSSILATVPERGTVGVPLITSMAASEALAPLPFTPDRDRCSWQDLSSKPPSLSCPILPRLLGSVM